MGMTRYIYAQSTMTLFERQYCGDTDDPYPPEFASSMALLDAASSDAGDAHIPYIGEKYTCSESRSRYVDYFIYKAGA